MMARFTDRNNVEWTVDLNIVTAKRLRTVLGVDVFDVADGSIVERIIADPVLLCDIVYVVCKDQAEASGISDEAFGMAMSGDAIGKGAKLVDPDELHPMKRQRHEVEEKKTAFALMRETFVKGETHGTGN